MESEKLKVRIGNSIAAYRKRGNMTQAELAEKLNYSDKAVSKWERGESVPDVLTMVQIAELFGVSVDALLGRTLAQEPTFPEQKEPKKRKADKSVIRKLVSLLVWFVALFVYVILSSFKVPFAWLAFIYAVPVDAITILSLRSAWRLYSWNRVLVSAIVWGSLLSLFVTLAVFTKHYIWGLFLLGLLGQVAVILWFRIFPKKTEE